MTLFTVILAIFASYGAVTAFYFVREGWRRETRGQYKCPTCGVIQALPTDDEEK